MPINKTTQFSTNPNTILVATSTGEQELVDALDERAISIEVDLVVTVGAGGDYPSISGALEYLSKRKTTVNGTASVLLLSGFVVSEQVLITQTDLSWITITSEDAEVTVDRSSITQRFGEEPSNGSSDGSIPHFESYPVFGFKDNAKSPIFDVLFNMDASGDRFARGGFSFTNNCEGYIKHYKGMKNCGGCALYATQNSRVYAYRSDLSSAGNGYTLGESPEAGSGGEKPNAVACFRGSWVNVRQANLSGAGLDGCYLGSSSVVEALGANFSGAQNFGIRCYAGGRINARDCDLTNCVERGIYAHQAGNVYAGGADFTGSGGGTLSNTYPIYAIEGSQVDAPGATFNTAIRSALYLSGAFGTLGGASFTNATTGVGLGSCVVAGNGCRVDVRDATTTGVESPAFRVSSGGIISAAGTDGGLNQTENTITSDGIIFR